MSCTGTRYGTAEQYSKMFCGEWPVDAKIQIRIESALDATAGYIDMALNSVGACDCALSAGGEQGLAYLNCLLAVVHYPCPCNSVEITSEQRQMFATEAQNIIDAILDRRMEVCDGETGSKVAALDWAEHGLTVWNRARIIINRSI